MLTDEKKKLIEAEERYRQEFRTTLATTVAEVSKTVDVAVAEVKVEKVKLGAQIMAFLNSSVGMWFLSSIVITGGAAVIQKIQHNYEVKQKNQEQLATYRIEIENRIDHMEYSLRRAKTVGEAKLALDCLFKSKYPLTPELQNRSLGSMYLNIYELLAGTPKQNAQTALDFIRTLEDAESVLQSKPDSELLNEQEKARFKKLIQSISALKFGPTQ